MHLPALAAQLQGFAHSADNVSVGVSLRKVLTISASLGSLIPTYLLLLLSRGVAVCSSFFSLSLLRSPVWAKHSIRIDGKWHGICFKMLRPYD